MCTQKKSPVHRQRETSESGSIDSDLSSPSNSSNKTEESDPSRSPQLSDKQKKLLVCIIIFLINQFMYYKILHQDIMACGFFKKNLACNKLTFKKKSLI